MEKQVDVVAFGLFSLEEVHAISVKRITNPIVFDALNKPLPDGLYDPALGPVDQHATYGVLLSHFL